MGPGPVEPHLDHALGFAVAAGDVAPSRAADLGSGAGLPGLVLALHWPRSRWTLVESGARRAAWLRHAVATLGLAGRVAVAERRAEAVGREDGQRGAYELVVARGFGSPAVTAECGAPLLAPGGLLVVSEPPEPVVGRWPAAGLALVGLELVGVRHAGAAYAVLRAAHACPARHPRRVPAKRPLF